MIRSHYHQRWGRLLLLGCLLLGITACASTQSLQQRFEQSLDEGALKQAERRLNRLAKQLDDEQQQANLTRFNQRLHAELQHLEQETNALLAQQRWSEASDKLSTAQRTLGRRESLAALEERISDHEYSTLAAVQQQWLLARATVLARQQKQLEAADQGKTEIAQEIRRWLAQETPVVLAFLQQHSTTAAEAQQWQEVLDTQEMLQRIAKEQADPTLQAQARSRLERSRHQAQARRDRQNQEQLEKHYQDFNRQPSAQTLLALKAFTARHRQSFNADQIRRTDQQVRKFIHDKTRDGDRAYAESRFRQARDFWQAAQQLAPDSEELKRKLSRVEQVLSSIKALETQSLRN